MGAPVWFRRPLGEGDAGPDVLIVQRKLGLLLTGVADLAFTLVVRGFQSGVGLPVSGVVDEATAAALGEQAGWGLLPDWYKGEPLCPGDQGYELVLAVIGGDGPDAVKRFQGQHGLVPTGVVDETTARLVAAMEVQ